MPEKMFQNILLFVEERRVSAVAYVEYTSQVLIRVAEPPEMWRAESLPHYQSKSVMGYNHAPEQRWRHLNVCQLESEIVRALPRGQCKDCKRVYTVRTPWEARSRGLTQEFEMLP
jgi:hypothetical protein